jgi:LuxR family maltose regulon positive regulatory protein
MDNVDTVASCQVLLARLMFIRGDVAGAAAALDEAEQFVRRNNYLFRMPDVATAQILILLRQGNLPAAAHLAQTHELRLSEARVHLAQGDSAAALSLLKTLREEAEAKGWADERLKVMVLQAVVLRAHGETDKALHLLEEALILAEQPGFIRIFVDEGMPMEALLQEVAKQRTTFNYVHKLLAAFGAPEKTGEAEEAQGRTPITQLLVEPLSERELEVLRLLGTDLSGPEIAGALIVSLSTMRTHTRSIYTKLGVNSRRAAVRRAEELHLL